MTKVRIKQVVDQFRETLEESANYLRALDVVRQNSKARGEIYLIGGRVYRHLAMLLGGRTPTPEEANRWGWDFLVESAVKPLIAPPGWTLGKNLYKIDEFTRIKDGQIVDLTELAEVHGIKSRRLRPCIDSYYDIVPFSPQAIVYDVNRKNVDGTVGIEALLLGEVRLIDAHEADIGAERKGLKNTKIYHETLAKELGYKAITPGK